MDTANANKISLVGQVFELLQFNLFRNKPGHQLVVVVLCKKPWNGPMELENSAIGPPGKPGAKNV